MSFFTLASLPSAFAVNPQSQPHNLDSAPARFRSAELPPNATYAARICGNTHTRISQNESPDQKMFIFVQGLQGLDTVQRYMLSDLRLPYPPEQHELKSVDNFRQLLLFEMALHAKRYGISGYQATN